MPLKSLAKIMAILSACFSFVSVVDGAETWTDWGSIVWLEAGWELDTIAVGHSAPRMVNPDNCPVAAPGAGYATNPADAGHSLFHTVALSAFLNKKEVRLLISKCVFNKPRIIAIQIR